MLRFIRPLALGLAAVSVGVFGCILPTDRSGELQVVADALPALIVKDTVQLTARLIDLQNGGADVPNAELRFSSSDSTIVLVSPEGQLVAIGAGTATVAANAISFDDADPAILQADVRALLELDSIVPLTTEFGSLLFLFGVGLNEELIFSVELGGEDAPVLGYIPDPLDPRFGALAVWAKPPAPRSSSVSILGKNGGLVAPRLIEVAQRDVYEPNDTAPRRLGPLNIGVFNPALAFESLGREEQRAPTDWYTFTNTAARDRTIIVGGQGLGAGTFAVFLTDSLLPFGLTDDFLLAPDAWTIGPSSHVCGGIDPGLEELDFPLAAVALKDLAPGTYHVLVAYTPEADPRAYTLFIANEYASTLPPDAAEENDFCNVATPIPGNATRNLTIDNPHDTDWFRFTIPAGGQTVTFRATAQDSTADLDLYILGDFRPDSLPSVSEALTVGDVEAITAALPAGDYFLVVVDFFGVPTDYTLNATFAAPPAGVIEQMPRSSAAERETALRGKRVGAQSQTARPTVRPRTRR
jgi:hypothetical protein